MFVATVPAVPWVDRVGRRPVLTVGAVGMATCHITIAIIIAKDCKQWETQAAMGWAAVAMGVAVRRALWLQLGAMLVDPGG